MSPTQALARSISVRKHNGDMNPIPEDHSVALSAKNEIALLVRVLYILVARCCRYHLDVMKES